MDTSKKTLWVRIGIFALVIIGVVILMRVVVTATVVDGKYDQFAQCLAKKDVKFYGAFWCPHCQEQEKWLAASRQTLAQEGLYVECSTADGKGQTQICIDEKIPGYPTWKFPDGTVISREMKLPELAQASGCTLPDAAADTAAIQGGGSSPAK